MKLKEDILAILKNNENTYISGQMISEKLGVSRAAIWKHINRLKEEGYAIDSLSNNGYKLKASPDLVTAVEIQPFLRTIQIGRKILHCDSIDSTNIKAKELAANNIEAGAVVISEEQTAGRGRLGRKWISPKFKGIWMSVILRPDIDPTGASNITLIGAAAVNKALRSMGVETLIKWPNDIILKGKKLCGILTEMSSELDHINYLVMGIGVNVNILGEEFPEDIKKIATSIKAETGKDYSRQQITASILNSFEDLYNEYIDNNDLSATIEICRKYSVLLGKEIQLMIRGKLTTARAMDISDEGLLIVRHMDGRKERIISGEVSMNGLFDYNDSNKAL